jgi:hypothetical protein
VIVPGGLDDLAIQTRWPKGSSDDLLVKSESIRADQRNLFEIHSAGNTSKEAERVLVAPFSKLLSKAKAEPDDGEDPDRLFLAPDDRFDFVCLKLHDGAVYFSIVEATTPVGCFFKPAMDRIQAICLTPAMADLLGLRRSEPPPHQRWRVGLESMIRHTSCRTKRLPTNRALVLATLPPCGLVETVTDNASCSGFSRPRASPVWTAETLHSSRTLSRVVLMASN